MIKILSKIKNKHVSNIIRITVYLLSLRISDTVELENLITEGSKAIVIARINNYKLIKVKVYRYWDLFKILLPVDTAWLITDEHNSLYTISFDKEITNVLLTKFL